MAMPSTTQIAIASKDVSPCIAYMRDILPNKN
jgi:hypothetical protein